MKKRLERLMDSMIIARLREDYSEAARIYTKIYKILWGGAN
jgi:hypothetical protein